MPRGLAIQLLCLAPTALLVVGASLAGTIGPGGTTGNAQVPLILGAVAVSLLLTPITLRFIAPGADLILATTAGMLQAIGIVALLVIASGSATDGDFYTSIATRQMLFVIAGSIAMVLGVLGARRIDRLASYPFTMLAAALGLTVVTMVLGRTVNGARLWLTLGPVTFQPSELARLLFIAFAAAYLYDKRYLVSAPWRLGRIQLPAAPYLLPLVIATLSSLAVLVLQNDLGMAALVAFGALATVSAAVRSRTLTVTGVVLFFLAGAVSYAAVSRVRDRVLVWLDPWHEPTRTGYQFVQSEYGLASGELLGRAANPATLRVPEVQTDFIIAAIGGELGWLVAVATLMLAGILVCRCALASLRAATPFLSLLVFATSALFAVQILLIAGGSLRVLPLTGLTLPLVSYGGTSMVATTFALGVIIGVGADTTVVAGRRDVAARANPFGLRQQTRREVFSQ